MIAEWDSACRGSPRPMGRSAVSERLQGVTRVAGSATSLLFPLQLFWVQGTQSAQLSSAPFTISSKQSSSLAGESSGEQALWDLPLGTHTTTACLPRLCCLHQEPWPSASPLCDTDLSVAFLRRCVGQKLLLLTIYNVCIQYNIFSLSPAFATSHEL